MSEFSLINQFCKDIGVKHNNTIIGVGDDAAVVDVPDNMQLATSVDTMVEGVHFFPNANPADLAHKLLAVNLSDMAAMGAQPKWATLALTLPEADLQWLGSFSKSLDSVAKRFGIQLVGGDTTHGPLTLSLNIMGLVPKNKAISRSGAQAGDAVYLSSCVGDAALALKFLQGEVELSDSQAAMVLPALHRPEPQVELGLGLLQLANACLDISDGLVADLAHIAKQSSVTIDVNVDSVPVSKVYQQYLASGGSLDLALCGGDDYQLAFTVSKELRQSVAKLASRLQLELVEIGQVVTQTGQLVALSQGDKTYQLASDSGYQHFG